MNDTETFRAVPGSETKTIPVICSWCGKIMDTKKWSVLQGEAIAPDYGICPDCHKKVRIGSGKPAPERGLGKTYRILIVDDEAGFCKMLFEVLHPFGYRLLTCNDGADAVEYYARLHTDIDLVLLDMKMSEMDGYETFMNMKRINPFIRAIVVTGYARDNEIRTMLAVGALCVMEKPFNPVTLIERIRDVLPP